MRVFVGFNGQPLFIRLAFFRCYSDIEDNWRYNIPHVWILGSPGVGMRGFMEYFVTCFKEKNPEFTVVMASFSRRRQLMKCLVFRPGQDSGEEFNSLPVIPGPVLNVYDGPPACLPTSGKMVVCTQPLLKEVVEVGVPHSTHYFPAWDLEELIEANYELELGLTPSQIKERFSLFGGLVKYCFSTSPSVLTAATRHLTDQISQYKRYDDILLSLRSKRGRKGVVPSLVFHVVPRNERDTHGMVIKFASPRVASLVDQQITARDNSARAKLYRFISGCTVFVDMADWVYKGYCRDRLRGGFFRLAPFIGSGSPLQLTLSRESFVPSHDRGLDGVVRDYDKQRVYAFRFVRDRRFVVSVRAVSELAASNPGWDLLMVWVTAKPCDRRSWDGDFQPDPKCPPEDQAVITWQLDIPQYLLQLDGRFSMHRA